MTIPSLAVRVLDVLGRCERAACIGGFIVLTGAVVADVLAREVVGTGVAGALRIAVLAMIVVAFFGAGLASSQQAHLRPRVFDHVFPTSWDRRIARLAEAVTALFCAGFALLSAVVVAETRHLGDIDPILGWMLWPAQAALPLAFAGLAIRHAIHALWPDLRPGPASEVV